MNHKNAKHVSLNLNVRGIGQSPTLAINELCKELRKEGKTVYNMGLGQSPFPVPVPVVEALKSHAHEKDYLPVKGLEALRNAISQFHKQNDNVNIQPENVLIGPGSKELMFILQLVYYGDIILPTPCWVSYKPQAKIIGRNTKLIHTTYENKWRVTAEELKSFIDSENDQFKPRLLVINYPSNPDGGTYSKSELEKLAEVARKHEMLILSDEIYAMLHYKGQHFSIARYYPEGTIISSGLSKWCGAGGWRLGTFAFPDNFEWLIDAMAAVSSETYTSVSAPIQHAAVRAFKGGILIDRYLWHARRILSFIGNRIANQLQEAGIRCLNPEGAFYHFMDFTPHIEKLKLKGITDSYSLCEKMLAETGVAALPGAAFQRPKEELSARISYVNFDGSKALSMSETIPIYEELPNEFEENCCAHLFQGIHEIVNWVRD